MVRWFDHARQVAGSDLPAGPFRGVPFLLKDLWAHYAGQTMTNGNVAWRDAGQLATEDTTFRQLVETVRQELAQLYLSDDSFTLMEISYLLGFSEQSSFSRAFKRWTGFTPLEFRGSA